MPTHGKIPSRWSLTGIGGARASKALADNQLLWPLPAIPANLSPLLSGLAPNRDHNGDLLSAISALPKRREGRQPLFSIFATDPLIRGKRIGPALLAKGY